MSANAPRLIVIEDSASDFLLIKRFLTESYSEVVCRHISDRGGLSAALDEGGWDAALCDFNVPGLDFSECRQLISAGAKDLPLIIVSGSVGEERAVELITGGVWDFVLKDNLKRLAPAVNRAIEKAEEKRARRHAEEALRESEERYRLLSENISDVIWILDLDSLRFRYISPSARSLFGASPEEAMARGFDTFFEAGQAAAFKDKLRVRGEEFSRGIVSTYTDEVDQPHGDGTFLAMEITTRYALDPTTGHREVFGVSRDISQRRSAQEAQRLSEEHNRAMIVNAPYGVLTAELDGKLLTANPAFAKILAFDSPEQLLGHASAATMARVLQSHPQVKDLLDRQPPERDAWQRVENVQLTRRDGTPAWINLEMRLYRSRSTGRNELEGFAEDITEKKRSERERQNLMQQMQQSHKMEAVGKLAGGIAHDFNNLITVIGGYSEFALARTIPGAPLYSALTEISAASKRAGALTSQLLAFSRNQILEPKTVDLMALIDGIAVMLRRLLGEGVELQLVRPAKLWPVLVDPGKIEQVITNLAVNGRDAMPTGGVLTIEASNFGPEAGIRDTFPEARGDFVALVVRDTGVGMDAETRERAFEPFFTTKEKGKGTGLGLSIVYGIVKQSGGHIRCESEPGKGAEFTILLPRSERESQASPTAAPTTEHAKGGTETILLIEDDETVRSFAALVLKAAGYTIIEAMDGQGALELASKRIGPIHLIICDVVMPHMDGPAVIRAIKPILRGVPFLFMSGYSQTELSNRGVLDPSMKLLHKPFTTAGLRERVREALDAPRLP